MEATFLDSQPQGTAQADTSIRRPGISTATLESASITRLTSERDGAPTGSLVIPYHDAGGQPTGFCRYRLPKPKGDQRYHQAQDSGTRAYLPPQLWQMGESSDLFVVEGEFKALSLIEAGFPAIGLPSFFSYTNQEGGKCLLDGILDAIQRRKPLKVYFVGDSDTATNPEFSRSALFLAEEMVRHDIEVLLPRIPVDGPGKGVDDCRDSLGEGFEDWWRQVVDGAEGIDIKSGRWPLQLRLLG